MSISASELNEEPEVVHAPNSISDTAHRFSHLRCVGLLSQSLSFTRAIHNHRGD